MLLNERSQTEKLHIVSFQQYDTLGKANILEKTIKRSVVARDQEDGEMNRQVQRIFRTVKRFCMMAQWCIHVIINFVHTSKIYKNIESPRENCIANYRLWVQ